MALNMTPSRSSRLPFGGAQSAGNSYPSHVLPVTSYTRSWQGLPPSCQVCLSRSFNTVLKDLLSQVLCSMARYECNHALTAQAAHPMCLGQCWVACCLNQDIPHQQVMLSQGKRVHWGASQPGTHHLCPDHACIVWAITGLRSPGQTCPVGGQPF
jgi:hypothetical protein